MKGKHYGSSRAFGAPPVTGLMNGIWKQDGLHEDIGSSFISPSLPPNTRVYPYQNPPLGNASCEQSADNHN